MSKMTWQHTAKTEEDDVNNTAKELLADFAKLTTVLRKHAEEEPECQHNIKAILTEVWSE